MEPRKKDSKKWTSLPPDFSAQIKTVFEENFREYLKNKSLKVDGRIYPSEIILRVGINENGRLKYENFEISLDHSADKQDTLPKIHLAVDAVASLLMDYFERAKSETESDSDVASENDSDRDADSDFSSMDLPYTWKQMDFEKEKIWFQFTTENPDLEAEANKILGLDEDTMLHDDDSTDDDGNDVDNVVLDSTTPKMFGGRSSADRSTEPGRKKKKEDMH